MKTQHNYEIHYDQETDFLEIFFGKPSRCTAHEMGKGIFVRNDIKTGTIKSVEILGFRKKWNAIVEKILNRLGMDLPIKISI